jgi:chorismate dehydratase
MRRLRISAISYLNTAPLMWDFEHGDSEHSNAGNDFDISYTVPSRCAALLNEGSADIGIIPVAAYATVPGLLVLPGVAIAARQAVRSILLVSSVPLEKIQTVALDISSLTSTALIKVLFAKWWGGGRTFVAMEPDVEEMLRRADAGLVIGDPALQVDRSHYFTYDLAEEWLRFTGKPFVFAFWALRKEARQEAREDAIREASPLLDLAAIFQRSRDHGLEPENLDTIAREWVPRVGLTKADVKEYLTENIHYFLDAQCMEGLRLFYRYAEECGALPKAPELRFLDAVQADTALLVRQQKLSRAIRK